MHARHKYVSNALNVLNYMHHRRINNYNQRHHAKHRQSKIHIKVKFVRDFILKIKLQGKMQKMNMQRLYC